MHKIKQLEIKNMSKYQLEKPKKYRVVKKSQYSDKSNSVLLKDLQKLFEKL
jgi:hypothetical protein